MDGPPENDICSICHSNFNTPCQANCSHWFCGSCILRVWDHGPALHPCKCPLCRREITLLVPSEASSRQCHMVNTAEILPRIERYNRRFGEQSNGLMQERRDHCVICCLIYVEYFFRTKFEEYMEYVQHISDLHSSLLVRMQDLPFLLRRLLRDIRDPQRTLPLFIRARVYLAMVASAIYVLSPVDIIPEGLLGIIGFLDDLIIILMCFLHVAALYRAVLLSRHGGS